jgi:hypothetical protein
MPEEGAVWQMPSKTKGFCRHLCSLTADSTIPVPPSSLSLSRISTGHGTGADQLHAPSIDWQARKNGSELPVVTMLDDARPNAYRNLLGRFQRRGPFGLEMKLLANRCIAYLYFRSRSPKVRAVHDEDRADYSMNAV